MTESTEKKTMAERAAALSEEVLESVGAGRQTAIEAVRKFVDTLDEAMPNLVDPSMRKKVLDAVLDLADQLATTNERVPAQHRAQRGRDGEQVGRRKARC